MTKVWSPTFDYMKANFPYMWNGHPRGACSTIETMMGIIIVHEKCYHDSLAITMTAVQQGSLVREVNTEDRLWM
mgnify:CR=1 FL=1